MLKQKSCYTHKRLQLNAGLLFFDLDLSELKDINSLSEKINELLNCGKNFLGATREGFMFRSQPVTRRYREDGKVFGSVGATVVESWDIELSGSLVEFTSDLICKFLPNSVVDYQEPNFEMLDVKIMHMNTQTKNVVWIGDISNGGFMVIELKNAVNVGGINFNTKNETENGINIRFIPHSGDIFNAEIPPFRIYFYDADDTQ